MGGEGPVQIRGGINFSASKLRGGGKISVQAFRGGGGQNFSAQTFEGQPEATKIYSKISAAAGTADIFQYTTFIFHANFALSGFT